jgi:hypothetical protein
MVQPRVSRGIMGKGTESFRNGPLRQCQRAAVEGLFCSQHAAINERIRQANEMRRAQSEKLDTAT